MSAEHRVAFTAKDDGMEAARAIVSAWHTFGNSLVVLSGEWQWHTSSQAESDDEISDVELWRRVHVSKMLFITTRH
jgi:hypothetical protein